MTNNDYQEAMAHYLASSGGVQKLAGELLNRLRLHPCLRMYVNHRGTAQDAGVDFRHTAPWHALGEQLSVAIAFAANAVGYGGEDAWVLPTRPGVDPAIANYVFAMAILEAETYAWRDEQVTIAGALPLPRHHVNVHESRSQFWSFATARELEAEAEGSDFDWIFLQPNPIDGGASVSMNRTLGRETSILSMPLEQGAIYPDDENLRRIPFILKLRAFLESPYVDKHQERLPREQRKALARLPDQPTDEPLVTTVTMRRSVEARATDSRNDEGEVRDWQHQWWVGSHFRAQWYPSLNAHKLIWIAPYLKGPTDKPMLQKVYEVRR